VLTVLLATKNRAPILREVLASYCALRPPDSGWELVVVDNGSTDNTPEVLAAFSQRLPLHSVREPKAGKNSALNTGLKLVAGDLVVLTDDDAFPAPDWLVQLRAAANQQPGYSMFGGAVIPRWEVPPPEWVHWIAMGPVFTLTDPSLPEGPMEPCDIFGPNMAVRNSVFQAGARFDTAIGPSGSSYAMGSETELVLRLGRQGHKACYVKSAVVEHYVRKEQFETRWVLNRGIRFGRGQYRLFGRDQNAGAIAWRGVPLHLYRRAAKQAALVVFSRTFGREESEFRARWRWSVFRGQIAEARVLALESRAKHQSTVSTADAEAASNRL
jgi:glycosyltransferase involved in cell wall biosynthesis